MAVLVGGGFALELTILLQSLQTQAEFVYVAAEFSGTPGENGLPYGRLCRVPMSATVTNPSGLRSAFAFLKTFVAALHQSLVRKPDLIMSLGCSHSVPVLIAGRLRGCRTMFVESITRADKLSVTGKIVYYLKLADVFVVQWPELHASYPYSVVGSIL